MKSKSLTKRTLSKKLSNNLLALFIFSLAFLGSFSVASASTKIITDPDRQPSSSQSLRTDSPIPQTEGFYVKKCDIGSVVSGIEFHDKGGGGDDFISAIYCNNGASVTKIIMDPERYDPNPSSSSPIPQTEGFYVKKCAIGSVVSGIEFHDNGGGGDNFTSAI